MFIPPINFMKNLVFPTIVHLIRSYALCSVFYFQFSFVLSLYTYFSLKRTNQLKYGSPIMTHLTHFAHFAAKRVTHYAGGPLNMSCKMVQLYQGVIKMKGD